jgi:Mlc titration factor MtfA (ptsG expression regulator)
MSARSSTRPRRRHHVHRPAPLWERVETGAMLGLLMMMFSVIPLSAEYGDPPGRFGFACFIALMFAGALAGGALAGALLGPAQRFVGSPGRAAAVGAALACVAAGTLLAATWHFTAFRPAAVAGWFGVWSMAGAVAGLLARDALYYQPEPGKPRHARRPPLWVLVLVELGWMMESLPLRRSRRRRALRQQPTPRAWIDIIRRNVPLHARLPAGDQRALLGHVNVFLAEKRFEGCGGIEITDEIRVTIAAQACLLLLHTPYTFFPTLRTILVYPEAYVAKQRGHRDGVEEEVAQTRLGESWLRGEVVLSWRSVVNGAANPEDGQNLVLHEFAHQLDQADGAADGIPETRSFGVYRTWANVLAHRFGAFRRETELGRRTVMDPYGATNRAEFFAVATETFFEKPFQLREEEPEVYDALRAYYGLDPAAP